MNSIKYPKLAILTLLSIPTLNIWTADQTATFSDDDQPTKNTCSDFLGDKIKVAFYEKSLNHSISYAFFDFLRYCSYRTTKEKKSMNVTFTFTDTSGNTTVTITNKELSNCVKENKEKIESTMLKSLLQPYVLIMMHRSKKLDFTTLLNFANKQLDMLGFNKLVTDSIQKDYKNKLVRYLSDRKKNENEQMTSIDYWIKEFSFLGNTSILSLAIFDKDNDNPIDTKPFTDLFDRIVPINKKKNAASILALILIAIGAYGAYYFSSHKTESNTNESDFNETYEDEI